MARLSGAHLLKTMGNIPAFRERAKIPAAKRKSQWLRTLVGVGVVVATMWCKATVLPDLPWLGVAIGCFAGGWMASQQLMLDLLKAIPQAIAAVVKASRGEA